MSAPLPRRRSSGLWRLARRTVSSLALLVALGVGFSFAAFLSKMEPGGPAARHADGAVALTGGPDRIAEAVDLLARGSADRLLITGVNPATSRANLARQTPQAAALFDCCIALGYEASNTVGNAAETGRWVRANNIRSLIVVTSNYHMPRALLEIGSVLPDVDLIANPVVPDHDRDRPWWGDAQRARLVLVEYLKYVVVEVRIRMAPRGPGAARDACATGCRRRDLTER